MAWQVDMESLLSAREHLSDGLATKVSLDALLVSVVAPLLREYVELNAYVDGYELMLYQDRNIGVAVGTDDGLMVPVIRGADQLSIVELHEETERLAAASGERTLSAGDVAGLTFTLSNVGATGAAWGGQAILPLGTTAMLSVGRAIERPVVVNGQLQVARVSQLGLTYDHRAFDGMHAARFLSALQERIETIGDHIDGP
jgi:pyruvate/2-oxoglutarate dehydrogenase complex dihydrolipoamide acyltransferase (E2) component